MLVKCLMVIVKKYPTGYNDLVLKHDAAKFKEIIDSLINNVEYTILDNYYNIKICNKDIVLTTIDNIIKSFYNDKGLFIYYHSGHGVKSVYNNRGINFLACPQIDGDNKSFGYIHIKDIISKCTNNNIVYNIFIDGCYSGGIVKGDKDYIIKCIDVPKIDSNILSTYVDYNLDPNINAIIFMSSDDLNVSYYLINDRNGNPVDTSLFTLCLNKCFKEDTTIRYISLVNIKEKIQQHIDIVTPLHQLIQVYNEKNYMILSLDKHAKAYDIYVDKNINTVGKNLQLSLGYLHCIYIGTKLNVCNTVITCIKSTSATSTFDRNYDNDIIKCSYREDTFFYNEKLSCKYIGIYNLLPYITDNHDNYLYLITYTNNKYNLKISDKVLVPKVTYVNTNYYSFDYDSLECIRTKLFNIYRYKAIDNNLHKLINSKDATYIMLPGNMYRVTITNSFDTDAWIYLYLFDELYGISLLGNKGNFIRSRACIDKNIQLSKTDHINSYTIRLYILITTSNINEYYLLQTNITDVEDMFSVDLKGGEEVKDIKHNISMIEFTY